MHTIEVKREDILKALQNKDTIVVELTPLEAKRIKGLCLAELLKENEGEEKI